MTVVFVYYSYEVHARNKGYNMEKEFNAKKELWSTVKDGTVYFFAGMGIAHVIIAIVRWLFL